ncbi:diguanylate cyclase [Paraburkholderia sp. EG287A]|uniref:sensor domain-containing diguanylate cyclase n=1 Tax=unclassified Paraburkholderia TaxID=2615204 RepID=UPI0034D2153A
MLLVTIFTVLALAGQFLQSLHDFNALEERTAIRIGNLANLTRDIVHHQVVNVQQLFGVLELSMEPETNGSGTVTLPRTEQLQEIRELYETSLPGLELLVLDEQANYVAESDPDVRNSTPAITRLVDRLRERRNPSVALDITTTLRGDSLVMGKAHVDSRDRRRAFMIAVIPVKSVTQSLSQLELQADPLVTLQNASGQLLVSYPEMPTAVVGKALAASSRVGVGPRPGSYYEESSLDGVRRLTVERDIPLPLADEHWTLRVGYSVREYRQGWYVSTGINIVICSILVLSWLAMFLSRLRLVGAVRHLTASRGVVEQLLADLPMPFVLVKQGDQRITRGNDALLKLFGAVAGPGSPVSRLFSNEEDCAALMYAGARQTVSMVTRSGVAYMLVTCSEVSGLTGQADPCWLFTLVDVTEQYVQQKQLQSEATTDPLTGLANRRSFSMAAELEVARARKQQSPLALLSFDLDFFKRVNDKFGHATGDVVLVQTARLLRGAMRDGDLAARLGGEEFAALLPNTMLQQAMAVAERIRLAIATSPVVLPDGGSLSVTVSIGVALFHEDEYDLSAALERADQALYRAKEAGRNRVEPETPPDLREPTAAT